jgi:flagellar biosynthetic protein FliS
MKAARRYRETSVSTANRFELVVQLYDGFLTYARTAAAALREGSPARTGTSIGQAMAILHELTGALDYSVAPELCTQLETVYRSLDFQLDRAVAIMEDLRQAWAHASREVAAAARSAA